MAVEVVSIVIAIVSLVATLVAASIAGFMSLYKDDRTRFKEAEAVRAKYRDPLSLAVQDLQARLRNFVDDDLAKWIHDSRKEYLLLHTCFLFGQFFSWVHILRQEVQFLSCSTEKANKELTGVLRKIRCVLGEGSKESPPGYCVLYFGEQHALGEVMTVVESEQPRCLGYARFCCRWKEEEVFRGWFERLCNELTELAEAEVSSKSRPMDHRLRMLQHLLIDLIGVLDPKLVSGEFGYTRRCSPAPGCPCNSEQCVNWIRSSREAGEKVLSFSEDSGQILVTAISV
ncbi:hypothetical protein JAAARDRAFT_200638 [Jaapia argillacea MUCL 33604]|uniref:Uncharacterized protein n=1 Tax=Jaapia argillacea MUCL 33604 TaxID=933084 RepID=A0A067P4L1_9AGAM|nr:hypothetical protein JAAARDRAFT_200638 [Jaapia argillacea MUCL 33604]